MTDMERIILARLDAMEARLAKLEGGAEEPVEDEDAPTPKRSHHKAR